MKTAIWIVVAIAALGGIVWFMKKSKTPAQPLPSLPTNYGAEGNLPAWRFAIAPDSAALGDSGLSYSTDTGTWKQSDVYRAVN